MKPELGIVEGFYGKKWSFDDRRSVAGFLAPYGYRFYLYAPKSDSFLRRKWREPHPDKEFNDLAAFADFCRSHKVRFGLGFSPYEAYNNFDTETRTAIENKVKALNAIGIDDFAVLFDDMNGTTPELAKRQAEIVDCIASCTQASRVFMCPTYYTDDVALDRIFGARPEGYLEELGQALDRKVEVFWTGEEVCSREMSQSHLSYVASQLQRKVALWDNYPVNDGPRKCQYLHIRGFTGRPSAIGEAVSVHAVNPALQPILSCIPALTLADSYHSGASYSYMNVFKQSSAVVAGKEIAHMLEEDLRFFQDTGLDRLDDQKKTDLRAKWSKVDHAVAREIVQWLDGAYAIDLLEIQTQ